MHILVSIIHQCDWQTLASWRATSRAFFAEVASLLRRRYDAHLAPFVYDIGLFNDLLRKHNAIISGSTALHYFLPDASWTPKILEIYVPVEKYLDFNACLLDPGGLNWTPCSHSATRTSATRGSAYVVEDDSVGKSSTGTEHRFTHALHQDEEDESDSRLLARHNLMTPSTVAGRGFSNIRCFQTRKNRRVHVICSLSNNPVTPLRFFFSSLLMNFITPDACVCGFPTATLDRVGVLKGTRLSYWEEAEFKKYRQRGFRFDTEPLRQALDMWDFIFFGERDILAIDFRPELSDPQRRLPIRCTRRGWIPSCYWLTSDR